MTEQDINGRKNKAGRLLLPIYVQRQSSDNHTQFLLADDISSSLGNIFFLSKIAEEAKEGNTEAVDP